MKKKPEDKRTDDLIRKAKERLKGQAFESDADMDAAILNAFAQITLEELPDMKPLEVAQSLIYDAFESDDPETCVKLAKYALKISPDCADAYYFLGQEEENIDKEIEYYRKGVEAGARALGQKVFEEDKGHFWGLLETRPYMRLRYSLMMGLREKGDNEAAVKEARALLELCDSDNLGVRYVLASMLVEMQSFGEFEELYSKYTDDGGAELLYAAVLSSFVRTGESVETESRLKRALNSNKHVPDFLVRKKSLSRNDAEIMDYIVGSEDEARMVTYNLITAWEAVPLSLFWLGEKTTPAPEKPGRNDPCHCGSGKKYKKCCGK